MLTVILAGFSILAGMLIATVGSVALVLYFSAIAATMIAGLELAYGAPFSAVVLAWFSTVFAVQFGFALATLILALVHAKGFSHPPGNGDRNTGHVHDPLGRAARTASGLPAVPQDRRRAADL